MILFVLFCCCWEVGSYVFSLFAIVVVWIRSISKQYKCHGYKMMMTVSNGYAMYIYVFTQTIPKCLQQSVDVVSFFSLLDPSSLCLKQDKKHTHTYLSNASEMKDDTHKHEHDWSDGIKWYENRKTYHHHRYHHHHSMKRMFRVCGMNGSPKCIPYHCFRSGNNCHCFWIEIV